MKKIKKILPGLLAVLLLWSCSKKEKKEDNTYQFYDGTVTATRNGAVWQPRLAAVYDSTGNKKRISLRFVDVEAATSDKLKLENISTTPGSILLIHYWIWIESSNKDTLLYPTIYYNGSFDEGADIANTNYLSADVSPFISIEDCDTVNNRVKGRLEVAFRRSNLSRPYVLDSVVYRDVLFAAPIHTYEEFYTVR